MMAGYVNAGYRELSRQAALIIGLATFTWCTITGTELLDALFRALVVYLVLSTITSIVSKMLRKMADEALLESDDEDTLNDENENEAVVADNNNANKSTRDNSE